MAYAKRIIIAVILGIVTGIICAYMGQDYVPEQGRLAILCGTVLNRAVIGLLIGISCWRMHWAIHGIILGFLGSLPISVPWGLQAFISLSIGGIIWGFLIELLTTVVFRAPMRTMEPVPATPPPPPAPPPEPPSPAEPGPKE
jgi:hypothetical protein